ncbi:unnamed protein product, partial [Closterium sp. NIES-53]
LSLPYLLLLPTLVLLEVLLSVVRLRLALRRLLALLTLVVALVVRVLLRSLAHTRWHYVLPLLLCVSRCRLLLRPLFLPFLTRSRTPFVLPVLLSRAFWLLLSLTLLWRPLLRLP